MSLSVAEGEIATTLGPNGAGKSTLLRAICGLLKPKRGTIRMDGIDVTRLPPDRLAKVGVVMVPEGRRIFSDLTVRENLRLGLALSVAERGYLMQSGRIVAASPIAELRDSQLMRELYLGEGKRHVAGARQDGDGAKRGRA